MIDELRPFKLRRLNRKGTRASDKAPPIARARSEEARRRIQDGLDQLQLIRTQQQYEEALARGVPRSTNGFLAWKRVGNDTLHKTHADLKQKIDIQYRRLSSFAENLQRKRDGDKPQKKKIVRNEVAILRKKNSELEAALASRGLDILRLLKSVESERKLRLLAEQKLARN
ncbi:hypothetical protein [Manganibacter manganicus]|uniref:Uncharacterized protein n=1 Tax=Manganibacter manganicus TaxID=1873176 RepID=A0A1V8RN19_9HYPH|nr:hypothetical protein [Pseudaminobacter manganicus]OQM74578.1 hypothetical protein BFN67_21425 [Pseudaminobacter manganicus]